IIGGECISIYLRSRSSLMNVYIACIYKAVGSFIFGAAISQSLTDIAKYTIGRLRPHFLSICKPNWSLVDCKSGYIENFSCTGDKTLVTEGRLSFFSGHSSFSMYCMLFLAVFCVSDFFKAPHKGDKEEISHTTLQETTNDMSHYGSTE
ncbi:hypothetical protein QTP86_015000, partial [Hemibagrus guttatus]